jgi:cobalamin synthase
MKRWQAIFDIAIGVGALACAAMWFAYQFALIPAPPPIEPWIIGILFVSLGTRWLTMAVEEWERSKP